MKNKKLTIQDKMERIFFRLLERYGQKARFYATEEDAFVNFKESAILFNSNVPNMIYLYASKHILKMFKWGREQWKNVNSREAEEVIGDIIIYLLLLLVWLTQGEDHEKN